MNRVILATMALLQLACSTPEYRKFERMSEADLYAYNRSVSALEQVFCSEQVGTGSHIRKRSCMKVSDIINGQVTTLDIPSSSSSVIYGNY